MWSQETDTTQLSNIVWMLDLAFPTDMTEKLNVLKWELRGKQKIIADMISTVKAFKSKLNLLIQEVQKKKMQHFPSVLQTLTEY